MQSTEFRLAEVVAAREAACRPPAPMSRSLDETLDELGRDVSSAELLPTWWRQVATHRDHFAYIVFLVQIDGIEQAFSPGILSIRFNKTISFAN